MSGGIIGSILKPVNKILHPLKQVAGDMIGTRAARQQAQAVQDQAAQQEAQYKSELTAEQQQNQLDGSDTSNVTTVTAGGTAQDSDDNLSASTKKNRQQLISQTLGL